jgi:hypothetical protein
MKLIAGSRGRLAAMEIFRPGTVFDVTRQPDGSFRVIELVEKEVPVVRLKKRVDGVFVCPKPLSRKTILATIRADRDAQ